MTTKIVYIGVKPSTTSGSDVASYGPHSPATLDQNFANLQAAVDNGFNGHSFANSELAKSATDQYLRIWGGDVSHGAYLLLFGDTHATSANKAGLVASGGLTITSPQLNLDASGNLLVGVTSGTCHYLSKSNSGNWSAVIRNTSGLAPYGLFIELSGATGGNGGDFIQACDNAVRFKVAGSGNVQNANNSYGAISDIKLKENVVTTSSKWDKFKQYRFVNYNLKSDQDKTKLLGLIAQEVELISPSLIEETPDYAEREIEVNGEIQTERYATGETTKGVKYSVVNLEADVVLQEAQARIESLESEIALLKERLLNAGF